MRKLSAIGIVATLLAALSLRAGEDVPWWQRQKIRFMWGQWWHARVDKSVGWDHNSTGTQLPRELFRNVAATGATVFAEIRGYKPDHARFAREFGMKYFATTFVVSLVREPGIAVERTAITSSGTPYHTNWRPRHCPLHEPVYEKWLVEPHLEGARQGLIDGIHIDWEGYNGFGEAGICYCDDCFARFMAARGLEGDLPEKVERFAWLEGRNLVPAYEENFSKRRVEMFTRLCAQLRAVKPDLLFSSYNLLFSDFTSVVHTPETPFIVLDARHYYNDDRQPWWESYGAALRKRGYIYIPGGWVNALFGAQASQVSAARWIYEASINEDGCWLWFEQELDDAVLRAYAAADREINRVQRRLGDFLFHGERDPHFVTAVEWTGRPELARALIHRTYHLGQRHLVHVNNVDSDWALRVRLRFPRLGGADRWFVHDAMSDLRYSRDGQSAVWTRDELRHGVVVALEPRSDIFLLLLPAGEGLEPDPSGLVRSREFSALPEHAAAAAAAMPASPIKLENVGEPSGLLAYTATEPMGFITASGPLAIGNAIRLVDSRWRIGPPALRRVKGQLWSPAYSPDGGRIAFVHDAGGRGQVHVMNEDGTDAVNISDNAFCERAPVWSPDGSKLAFISDREGDWDICVMDADGSGQRRLAGNPGVDRAAAWSPDGTRLAWESHVSGMPNIWVCDADGRNSRPLIEAGAALKIERVRAWKDPPETEEVEPILPGAEFYLTEPVWAPDGRRIAGIGLSSGQMVFVLDADGARMLQLIPWIHGAGNLCWSPDGTRLAGTFRTAPQESERSGIFLIKADGSEETPHSMGHCLVDVTPQGPRLGGAQRKGLVTWYSHGSAQPRRVLNTFAALAWAPDGKTLAFSADLDPSGAFHVYTISPDGGEPTRIHLTRSAWPQQISWRPR